MQCLYCKRKLGLFASKKRPFCSEQHEVAYNDEQAGLAMRRVMDPLFSSPGEKAPLQAPVKPAAPQPVAPAPAEVRLTALPAPPVTRKVPASLPPPLAEAPPPLDLQAISLRDPEPKPADPAPQPAPTFEPIKPPPVQAGFAVQARLVPFALGDAELAGFEFMQPLGEARLPESGLGPVETASEIGASSEEEQVLAQHSPEEESFAQQSSEEQSSEEPSFEPQSFEPQSFELQSAEPEIELHSVVEPLIEALAGEPPSEPALSETLEPVAMHSQPAVPATLNTELAGFGFAELLGEARLPEAGLGPVEEPEAGQEIEAPVEEVAEPLAELMAAEQVTAPVAVPAPEPMLPPEPVPSPEPVAVQEVIENPGPLATRLHEALQQERPIFPVPEEHTPAMLQAPAEPLAFDAEPQMSASAEPAHSFALAPLVPANPLNPSQNKRLKEQALPLEPPELALRFPFANLTPLPSEIAMPEIDLGPAAPAAMPWNAVDRERRAPDSELSPAELDNRFPALDIQHLHSILGLPVTELAPIPRQAISVAGEPRWKVLQGLRESPARLRNPQVRTGAILGLGSVGVQRSDWTIPPVTPTLALPIFEAQTWVFETITPSWQPDPRNRAVQMGTAGTTRPEWSAAISPAVPEMPVSGAYVWASPPTLPIWQHTDPSARLNGAKHAGLGWIGQEPTLENLPAAVLRQPQQVCYPPVPEPEGLAVMRASLMQLARTVHEDRRRSHRALSPGTDSVGIQRVRVASLIQIREPDPEPAEPKDLPSASPKLDWKGVRPLPDKRVPGSALPLRPDLRNPGWHDPAHPAH